MWFLTTTFWAQQGHYLIVNYAAHACFPQMTQMIYYAINLKHANEWEVIKATFTIVDVIYKVTFDNLNTFLRVIEAELPKELTHKCTI